jgi:subfamily B ATP-binding cassette protein MsbA
MKKTIKYFLPYLKNYKKELFLAFVGMIAVAFASAASAHLMKPTLDEMFIKKDSAMLAVIPAAIIVLFIIKAIGNFVQGYFMVYVGEDIVRELRDRMVLHLMHQDMAYLQKMRSGELISRVISDITRIRSFISSILPRLATNIITVVALTGYVLYVNFHLAVYFFFVIPLLALPIAYLSRKMKRYSHRSQESNSDMTSRLSEIFNNIEVIKSNFSHDYEIERFRKESAKVFRFLMKQNRVSMMASPAAEIIGSFALALVIYSGGSEVLEGRMSVGEFFAFMAALAMLYGPIKILSRIHTKIQDAVAAFERIESILSREIESKEGELEMAPGGVERIVFENVSLSYGSKRALQDISIDARRGRVYALVGDSGAGKSSLTSLLVRFYDPDSGTISVNGKPIEEYRLASLLGSMAFVTQRIFIFNDTVAANVAYGRECDRQRVLEALEKAHALDFVQSLPDGIDTYLDEFGANLSGGQRQRIALARALYKNPSVLILDEATSALDNKSEEAIKRALEEIKSQMITFIVAHRLSTVESADEILVFREGRIVERGTYDELLRNGEEFRRLARAERE